MFKFRKTQGQGLVEYIILIALMGVALIAVIRTLGNSTKAKFSTAAAQVSQL